MAGSIGSARQDDQVTDPSRRIGRLLLALAAVLALPLLVATPVAEATGLRLDSVVTRTMVYGSLLVLLCWFGIPTRDRRAAILSRTNARGLLVALALSLAVCTAFSALLIALGAEALRPELFNGHRIALALVAGLAVSCVEEPLFRGFLFRRFASGGAALGALVSSSLYAQIHYLRPAKIPTAESYTFDQTLDVYRDIFDSFADVVADPAPGIGLFLLGLLLCLIAYHRGLVWSIGAHTGLVCYLKGSTSVVFWMQPGRHLWFGSQNCIYDGLVFHLVCALLLFILLAMTHRSSQIKPTG